MIFSGFFCIVLILDGTWADGKCLDVAGDGVINSSAAAIIKQATGELPQTPVEQYWK